MLEKKFITFRIIKEIKLYQILLLSVLLTILFSLNRVVISSILGKLVDTAMLESANRAESSFLLLICGILTLTILSWLKTYFTGLYTQKGLYYIRARTVKTIEELSYKSIAVHSTGELISRINNDIELIRDFLQDMIPETVFKISLGVFATVLGLHTNWKMALFVISIPIAANTVNYYASKPMQKKQKEMQDILGDASNITQDVISGNAEIKTFGLVSIFKEKFEKIVDMSVRKKYEIAKLDVMLITILDSTSAGAQVLVILLGLYFVLQGKLTLGDLIIFQQIQDVLRSVFRIDYLGFRKAAAAQERIFEIWDEDKETAEGEIKEGDERAPLIAFKNVNFSYPQNNEQGQNSKRLVLSNFSLDINRNESIAIVGPSGCGKTTIVKLICGLIKPDSGVLVYKGFPYEDWDKTIIRDGISVVDQNTYLFPTTLFENIACGIYWNGGQAKSCRDAETIRQACKQADIEEFINSLEKGYDTVAGEWGVKLSGGQKQKIAIARAFVRNAELLILDEPTSNLDAQSEQEVQYAVEKLMEGRTTLIIAHRLSTVKNVDRIIVINNGWIVEEGSHESLLNNKSHYYNLYQKQFR